MPNEPAASKNDVQLSIRYLAEFLLRGGSIDARFSGLNRAAEGGRIHRRLQRQGGAEYKAEVPLFITIPHEGFCYHLTGRADGVISGGEVPVVDEIKTTAAPLEILEENSHPAHWAQACIYAHILCGQRQWEQIDVRLTYFQVDTEEIRRFTRRCTAPQLADMVHGLLAQYHKWAQLEADWGTRRNASLATLAFPFGEYREGQRSLAIACYNTFRQGGRLFCCAPTGIGKTVSTLFPALKALAEGHGERIFYLTAKTITRTAAENTLALLEEKQPLALRSLTLTAKDKVCFLEERNCTPEACPWAEGYYDRLNGALYEILTSGQGGRIGRGQLEQYARQYRLCPYELSLDLALWCDCVICDYNYLFDPVVHLQRFFESGGDFLFLVDEAHNLVDRSREMYSASLHKSSFYNLKKQLPKTHRRLHRALAALNSGFVALRKQCAEEGLATIVQPDMPAVLQKPLEQFVAAAEAFLEEQRGSPFEKELLALYFEALFYNRIAELYDERFATLLARRDADVEARLLCLDPAAFLDESMDMGRAAVLFSATLQPLPYYRETLGGGATAKLLELESPFPPENLGLFIADGVSTKYADRQHSLDAVAALLAGMAEGKQGNYIAYFPSYSYMRQVHEYFVRLHPHIPTLLQAPGMEEVAREEFLAAFQAGTQQTLLGFCVMGGIFAEGVDLPGDRLIGVAVVGVGLPQIGPEPDALRRYYDEKSGSGFAFAYQFPGMNKVMQAVGRVIRSPGDKGVALLIDSRFTAPRYLEMFPAHWRHWRRVASATFADELQSFWRQAEE